MGKLTPPQGGRTGPKPSGQLLPRWARVRGQGVRGQQAGRDPSVHAPRYPFLGGAGAASTGQRSGFLAGRLPPSHLAAVRLFTPLRSIPEVVFCHNCTRRWARHSYREPSPRVRCAGGDTRKCACVVPGRPPPGPRGGVGCGAWLQRRRGYALAC